MAYSLIIPSWLDQVPRIDYSAEKALLQTIENWAVDQGWIVSNGASLPIELRQRTDVLLVQREGDRRLRLAVLPKSSSRRGSVRVDASNLRTLELVRVPGATKWRALLGSVPISEDFVAQGWNWMEELLFRE